MLYTISKLLLLAQSASCVENEMMKLLGFDYDDIKDALPNNVCNNPVYKIFHYEDPIDAVLSPKFWTSFTFQTARTLVSGNCTYIPRYKYKESVIRNYCEMNRSEFQYEAEELYHESTKFFDDADARLGVSECLKKIGCSMAGSAVSLGTAVATANPIAGIVAGGAAGYVMGACVGLGADKVKFFPAYSSRTYLDDHDLVNHCIHNECNYDPNYYFSLNLSGNLANPKNN